MSPTLLDTHALVWLLQGSGLGQAAKEHIHQAHKADNLAVCAITFWEIAILIRKGRLDLGVGAAAWRRSVLALGIQEFAVDGGIAVESVDLEALHPDPADRLILSTALRHDAALVTADERLLAWEGRVVRIDARR
ncbi:type II toxin-antitoxin system VapC family toxin [Paramagnetospirillum kuznetsovii]|uniref:type II toxin-antitoxin system VapC family toxin n=1 Tax=Paramagnetospirillum kuznetsovii TaxID=2053833 RepID=UPI001374D7A1|nr:type II toxin-antitoxin system VapC family toxin [Paramagnetospirillum kuznetsovii]